MKTNHTGRRFELMQIAEAFVGILEQVPEAEQAQIETEFKSAVEICRGLVKRDSRQAVVRFTDRIKNLDNAGLTSKGD